MTNLSTVMKNAWKIAKAAVKKFGGGVKEFFSGALKMAWAEAKQEKSGESHTFTFTASIPMLGSFEMTASKEGGAVAVSFEGKEWQIKLIGDKLAIERQLEEPKKVRLGRRVKTITSENKLLEVGEQDKAALLGMI